MNERPALSDAAIRAMLEERVTRSRPIPVDVDAIVAAAEPRSGHRPWPGTTVVSRLAVGAAAIMVTLLAVVLVVPTLVVRPAARESAGPVASHVASAEASAALPSARAVLDPLRLLGPAEAGDLIRTRSADFAGTLVVVDGRLEMDQSGKLCPGAKRGCNPTVLAGSGGGFVVRPVGDIGPGPWDGSGPLEGALILRLGSGIENGNRIAEFVGQLTVAPTGGPAWFVQDILEGAAHVEGAYAAVQGWLVRDPAHPCPSDPRNPTVGYGCPTDDWLSETEFQPLQADGSSIGPPAALALSSGSYDRWARDPAAAGRDGIGVEPRGATYLLWLISDGCGPNADCAGPPPRWRIVGRFDSLARPAGTAPSPDPVTATDGRVPPPSGDAWTVAQLLDRPLGDGTFLVRGWLVATPPLRCLERATPTAPDYGCSEVDWLTDESFQPWVADGLNGSTRDPTAGLRVQNGAYAGFAPEPASGPFGARTPRLGDWIVRETTHGFPCPFGNACKIPTLDWEVIARLP